MCKYPGSRALSVAIQNLARANPIQVRPENAREFEKAIHSCKYLDDKETGRSQFPPENRFFFLNLNSEIFNFVKLYSFYMTFVHTSARFRMCIPKMWKNYIKEESSLSDVLFQ